MGCIAYFFFTVTFFSISEVSLLLYVAGKTGIAFTMICCALTGIIGGYFVKSQGLETFSRIKKSLGQGQIPADETVEALLLLIVGVLLCVPGFITDILGFLIIVPGFRKMIAATLVQRFKAGINSGQFKVYGQFNETNDTNLNEEPQEDSENSIENATIIEVVNEDNEDKEKKRKESHDQKKSL